MRLYRTYDIKQQKKMKDFNLFIYLKDINIITRFMNSVIIDSFNKTLKTISSRTSNTNLSIIKFQILSISLTWNCHKLIHFISFFKIKYSNSFTQREFCLLEQSKLFQ